MIDTQSEAAANPVQDAVVEVVRAYDRTYDLPGIIEQLGPKGFDARAVSDAVWSLADRRELTFTSDWKLTVVHHNGAHG